MKKATELALYRELKYGEMSYTDIDKLFDIYTKLEVYTIEDLIRDHSDFHSFIKDHMDFFILEEGDENIISKCAFDKLRDFKLIANKYYGSYRLHQEEFVSAIKKLVGGDKSAKILEVGSGGVPYSSILLGMDGYNIYSMDNFNISEKCLERFNVKSYRQLFNAKTSVKDYDIVVGRRPCSAIEHIVTNCSRDNVDYYLRLCSCNAPGGVFESWKTVLSELDSNIRYKHSYVYNFNASKRDENLNIEELIDLDSEKYCG